MKFKNISKLLTIGILFNSFNLSSFASVLSEDTRYETFEGNNIAISDILEEDKVDVEIEGNTLVNLLDLDLRDKEATASNPTSINSKNKEIIWDWSIGQVHNNWIQVGNKLNIAQPNKTYTLIANIKQNNPMLDGELLNINIHGQVWIPNCGVIYVDIPKGKTGICKWSFTTTEDVSRQLNLVGWKVDGRNSNGNILINGGKLIIGDIMLLEGDWTNKEVPKYFEGLKSSFEDQLVTQEMIDNGQEKAENLGKYKVECKITGKNKFDISKYISGQKLYVQLKPNTQYRISGLVKRDSNYVGKIFYSILYDATGRLTPANHFIFHCNLDINYNHNFTTDDTGLVWFETYGYDADYIEYLNIQIEEGSVMTEYEPYKESVKTFYLNSPLLKGDTIELINGQATHVRRYKQVILDGSENWIYEDVQGFNIGKFIWYTTLNAKPIPANTYPQNAYICDKLQAIHWWTSKKRYDNSIYYGYFGNNITILKDEFNKDVNLLKQWLSKNPVKFIYELDSAICEPIKADLSVQLFEGTTHISNNSNIAVNMEVTVDRVLNRAAEAIELAKTNPTVENLSRARMWVNLAKESVKKDELQSEINSITNINDLQLERKTVTANMDVYIKSENMLSMSLNTNSITFDGYSGVEDMEMLGAVNISVNSSLPYDLNAYLPSEIANADKSEIMDIEILKIKESSNVDYQNFDNTTDKIVLKDGCNAGNNLIHNIDLKLASNQAHKADVYKTVIKFEAEQK